MKTELKSPIFQNLKMTQNFSKDFKNQKIIENETFIDNEYVTGTTKEIQVNGVIIHIRNVIVHQPYTVQVKHDFPLFKLHFEIEGSSIYTPNNTNSTVVNIPNNHYNFFYIPVVDGRLHYDTTKRNTVEIKITINYLKRILGKNSIADLDAFGANIQEKLESLLFKNNGKLIHPELHQLLESIKNCNLTYNLKKAYLEAKIAELMILVFNDKDRKKTIHNLLSNKEIDLIKKAESYIRNNLKRQITISELSDYIGMNTSKLKHNFKVVFNSTIFKYITKLRMEKAKQCIIANDMNISQISYQVGYKNPQHFTTAFKRMYGFLPSELKNNC